MYSLGQAAKVAGVSKTTISNALKSGKLSYIDKTKSGYKIDPSELNRVYPKPVSNSNLNGLTYEKPSKIKDSSLEVELLRELLKEVKEERDSRIADLKADHEKRIDELVSDRDNWKEQASKVTALLEDRREKPKSFWTRFLNR